MSAIYPRSRIEAVLRSLSLDRAFRITLSQHSAYPLHAGPRRSRFSDGTSFGVLYAAMQFETAFVEVLIRDRFVKRDTRSVHLEEIRARSWIELALAGPDPLRVVDLREDGCIKLGAPTDAVHARNHSAGRALGRSIYEQHADIDGILFSSRLTNGDNLAIFDRAVGRVIVKNSGELELHPQLDHLIEKNGIIVYSAEPLYETIGA